LAVRQQIGGRASILGQATPATNRLTKFNPKTNFWPEESNSIRQALRYF
jgi:hypothetical protein